MLQIRESHELEILGYVNPDSAPCRAIRQTLDELSQLEVDAFRSEHGFFPSQCRQRRGVLEHPEEVIRDYMRELDAAGFNIHAHVIGDRALRVAVDSFEALDAYTIHGARLFGHAEETGSLEVGKLADIAVLDRDLFELTRQGRADEISESSVTMTMPEGNVVFERNATSLLFRRST